MNTLIENIIEVSTSTIPNVIIKGDETDDELLKYILNFSLNNELRINALEKYYNINKDETIDIISRITGMYQFSGTKILHNFLLYICLDNVNISIFLRLECAKSLLSFYEFEEDILQDDDATLTEIKTESNLLIKKRNSNRIIHGYKALNNVCSKMCDEIDFPTPCRIDAIHMLMENIEYKNESNIYFKEVINDDKIDCDYRYKSILSLEKKQNISNRQYFITNVCLEFVNNNKNRTMYRILSGQYLLQNCKLEETKQKDIYNILYEFSTDSELDYNLRADAADTLLSLANTEYKDKAKEIIMILGGIGGAVRNLYENAQNVHTKEIEKSIGEILEYLLLFPTLFVNENEIDFSYIANVIHGILKEELPEKCIDMEEHDLCIYTFCKTCQNKIKDGESCSDLCGKHDKIKISLNRIEMDRTLYSKYSANLSKIFIKLWSYIQSNEFCDAMTSRLLEELEEMSGTCSTGFVSRLINTLSGFGNLNIRISFDDQIISNFTGRLNMYARKLTEDDSPFRRDKFYDIAELYIYSMGINKKYPKIRTMDKLIEKYLSNDKDIKKNKILEDFEEQVLNEMMLETNKFNDRRHFLIFFRVYMLRIREELYEEFKEYITDTEFDLCIRKAISSYEGVNFLL